MFKQSFSDCNKLLETAPEVRKVFATPGNHGLLEGSDVPGVMLCLHWGDLGSRGVALVVGSGVLRPWKDWTEHPRSSEMDDPHPLTCSGGSILNRVSSDRVANLKPLTVVDRIQESNMCPPGQAQITNACY